MFVLIRGARKSAVCSYHVYTERANMPRDAPHGEKLENNHPAFAQARARKRDFYHHAFFCNFFVIIVVVTYILLYVYIVCIIYVREVIFFFFFSFSV